MKIEEQKIPISRVCKECGKTLPIYPGRYPVSCPNCGAELTMVQDPEELNKLNKAQQVIKIISVVGPNDNYIPVKNGEGDNE